MELLRSISEMFLLGLIFLIFGVTSSTTQRPHIIYILIDDMGWNDLGFHGSGQIPTPNIDALAFSGVILNRFYTQSLCTPSRAALMTGKYPIRTGMQHAALIGGEARGLPLEEKLLPQYLQDLGYNTHIVGKWHLGFYKKEYTPTYRGFESHLGFWTAHHDYNDHYTVESPFMGYSMVRGLEPAYDAFGQYSTDVFTNEAVKIINQHNASRPLFLYFAHAAVHSGNAYNPLPAKDEDAAKFTTIENYNRRRFAGITSNLDESVGTVVESLRNRGMLENSIIVLTTDNGGAAAGFNRNIASNWPLRGMKNTYWEGGVRGAGLIWSPQLSRPGRVSHQVVHMVDMMPTLISAAGGDPLKLSIDGLDLWKTIRDDSISPRKMVLHNIDIVDNAYSIMIDGWKLIKGDFPTTLNKHYGPSGRKWRYEVDYVIGNMTGQTVKSIGMSLTKHDIEKLLRQVDVNCGERNDNLPKCNPHNHACLFNVFEDPCEYNNLIEMFPEIYQILYEEILTFNRTVIPPSNIPITPESDPANFNYRWVNFGDYLEMK